jgi:hypothetical protein
VIILGYCLLADSSPACYNIAAPNMRAADAPLAEYDRPTQ